MKKHLTCILCLLLILTFAACSPAGEQTQSGEDGPAAAADDEAFDTGRQTYDLTELGAPGSSVTVETAALGAAEDVPAADSINGQLQQLADDYVAEKAEEDAMAYAGGDGAAYVHERSYEVVYQADGMISVVARGYDNSDAAAHSSEDIYAYVFDAATGERVTPAALLGDDWADILRRYVAGQIRASGQGDYYYPGYEELIPAALKGDCWYLMDDGLHILFNADVIAPRVLGALEFVYPLER